MGGIKDAFKKPWEVARGAVGATTQAMRAVDVVGLEDMGKSAVGMETNLEREQRRQQREVEQQMDRAENRADLETEVGRANEETQRAMTGDMQALAAGQMEDNSGSDFGLETQTTSADTSTDIFSQSNLSRRLRGGRRR